MKKIALITSLLIASHGYMNAQFNVKGKLNKLKNSTKKDDVKPSSSSSSSTKSVSSASTKNDPPTVSSLESNKKSIEKKIAALETKPDLLEIERLESSLKNYKRIIDNTKTKYPDYKGISKYESFYTEAKAKHEKLKGGDEAVRKNYSAFKSTISAKRALEKNERPHELNRIYYKNYAELKESYKTHGAKDAEEKEEIDKFINELDQFYNSDFEKNIANFEFYKSMMKADKVITEKRKTVPNTAKKEIEKAIGNIEYGIKIAKDPNLTLVPLKNKYEKIKTEIDEYVSSGAFKAYTDSLDLERSKSVFPAKPGSMHNSSNIAIVKSRFPKEKGTALKYTITSNSWYVDKNDLGIPIKKNLTFQVIAKDKNGKCHVINGFISKNYEGNGKYGSVYINKQSWVFDKLIFCGNVK